MAFLESVMEELSEVFEECRSSYLVATLEFTDRIVLNLERCDESLRLIIDNCSSSSPEYPLMCELDRINNQLLVQWILKLNRLEGSSDSIAGRPKKVVDMELVCIMHGL